MYKMQRFPFRLGRPAGGATTLLLICWLTKEGDTPSSFSFSIKALGVSMSGRVFSTRSSGNPSNSIYGLGNKLNPSDQPSTSVSKMSKTRLRDVDDSSLQTHSQA